MNLVFYECSMKFYGTNLFPKKYESFYDVFMIYFYIFCDNTALARPKQCPEPFHPERQLLAGCRHFKHLHCSYYSDEEMLFVGTSVTAPYQKLLLCAPDLIFPETVLLG